MTARSPLEGRAADMARLDGSEVPFLAQVDVRVGGAKAAALGFPVTPNTVERPDVGDVLWLGPDEWLVVSDPGSAETVIHELEAALEGTHRSIVDVSANRAVFELAGPNRYDLLSSPCPIDLHPRSWGEGRCAQTVFGGAQVLLHERPDATRVFVRPSFSGYVVDLLLAAASS